MLTIACCFIVGLGLRLRVRISFSVWLVSGKATLIYITFRSHCHSPSERDLLTTCMSTIRGRWKWRTWKWRTIKIARHEIAGHEI